MIVNLSEIPGAFDFPRPNWNVIRGWVEKHVAGTEPAAGLNGSRGVLNDFRNQ